MKKIFFLFFLLFPLFANAQLGGGISNPGSTPGGINGSVQYNNNGTLGGITFTSFQGLTGVVQQFFQAANLLYQITQGMEIDPRYYGASCNTEMFVGNNYYSGGYFTLTTTAGSPVISIANVTFNPTIAGIAGGGDVGKTITLTCNNDLGPTTYIQSVDTVHNTATLAENMAFTCGSGTNSVVLMGGYPTDYSTPSLAADDTIPIEKAAEFSAIYHGGKVVLPPRCLVHNLSLNPKTWLVGNNGGNNYGLIAVNYAGINTSSDTILYCGSTGFNDDFDATTGAPRNECISVDNASDQTRYSNFTMVCPDFPYLGFNGMTTAAFGQTTATAIDPEHVVLDHVTTMLCPVGWGTPFGWNQAVTFTASISGTTMTVSAITSTNLAQYDSYFNDFLAVGRTITGVGVTAGTVITAAPPGGQAGTYTVNNSQTVSPAITMTATVPTDLYTSGSSRHSEFVSDGIGINGSFSDAVSVDDIVTGAYTSAWWLGPPLGSAGCGANRITAGRDEESGFGIVLDNCLLDTITGRQEQFNNGAGLVLMNGSAQNIWVGGLMQGNNPAGAQIVLYGASHDLTLSDIDWDKHNYSAGGTSAYLIDFASGFTGDYVTIEGGQPRNGYATGILDVIGTMPAHYRQAATGIPFIDTSGASPLVSAGTQFTISGCSASVASGGATAGTYTSGTNGTCTAVITMGMSAPNGWNCSATDLSVPADTQVQTASSVTTATIAGTTVSGNTISFSCLGY